MDLPLHGGAAPHWLVHRMIKLAGAISDVMVSEFGRREFVARLSDPDWFQALSCVLAFDWHSSGTTTVLCGVLKSVLDPGEHGVAMVGGKGARSRAAPAELVGLGEDFSFTSGRVESLVKASRLSAKVDSALLQDDFDIYHHAMFVPEDGDWAVVQQGMNASSGLARRYHWSSENLEDFIREPHSGIACDERRECVLDMTAEASEDCRSRSVDLALGGSSNILDCMARVRRGPQRSLLDWDGSVPRVVHRELPARINWRVMDRIYDFEPRNYEELVLTRGIGGRTVRALALISELIYGDPPSWRDPVKYSYCLGGKDGVPYPVDRGSYDESIEILGNAIRDAKIGQRERMAALRRLRGAIPGTLRSSSPPWKA
jgi:hypothetical protein